MYYPLLFVLILIILEYIYIHSASERIFIYYVLILIILEYIYIFLGACYQKV